MSDVERPRGPSFRLNPQSHGYAGNRSITMAEVMWQDTDQAARQAGVTFSEWARRALAAKLASLGYPGYSEAGDYPADRKPGQTA